MPELPDVTVYLEALETRLAGATLLRVELKTPFLLRSVQPPLSTLENQPVAAFRRVGKRLALGFANGHWLVLHLMIAGRLHWEKKGGKPLAAFVFSTGTMYLTEAGTQHRASLHVVADEAGLRALDAGGIDPLSCSPAEFAATVRRENHTLKRTLTDPRLFSGIGNAFSDEILHAARLSPVALSQKLGDEELARLQEATVRVLNEWTARLRAQCAGKFPEKVTAFRPEMAVHGKYKEPCPVCSAPVQRIRYASNETNYCARCQTGGKLLADRALSRLLGSDWPKSIDDIA